MRELSAQEGRVLGALVEKELTTPQGYPLTDSALLAACNQSTSRDPVVSYDTATVRLAVRSLREEGLVRTVHRTGERSDKHRHELVAALGLSPAQTALLGLLLLRGPQTLAELRARSERWHPFADVDEVEQAMSGLTDRDHPLAVRLERQPGRKESRYAQLLTGSPVGGAPGPSGSPLGRDGDVEGGASGGAEGGASGSAASGHAVRATTSGSVVSDEAPGAGAGGGPAADAPPPRGSSSAPAPPGAPPSAIQLAEEVRALREEVAQLRAEVAALREQR